MALCHGKLYKYLAWIYKFTAIFKLNWNDKMVYCMAFFSVCVFWTKISNKSSIARSHWFKHHLTWKISKSVDINWYKTVDAFKYNLNFFSILMLNALTGLLNWEEWLESIYQSSILKKRSILRKQKW